MTAEEIAAVVQEIRQRVRARYEKQVEGLPDFCLPSLTPLNHARDAAEGKVASIGAVNPRPPGVANALIQGVKKLVARGLTWHVREQIEFNRAVIEYMDRIVPVLNEQNRHMLMLAGLEREYRDAVRHVQEWRAGWEEKWTRSEVQMLRTVAELQAAFQHRVDQLEASFREQVRGQHGDYLGALERTTVEIQKRLWDDLARLRQEHERQIHTELRLIRQRAQIPAPPRPPSPIPQPPREEPQLVSAPRAVPRLDYGRFADRFRGSVEHVAATQRFYLPYFQGRSRVVDLGCGRGEFLDLMKQHSVAARGVDSDAESVAVCAHKQLEVTQADLFDFLAAQEDLGLDGIFSSQVVEHLPPARVPELLALAAAKLERGGVLAIETPNPECLASFAQHFYLDPTHTRPVPSALLHFYFQENGLGSIEVHQLAPAAEAFPEVAALGAVEGLAGFQKKFFGGLDYAIIGRKL